jgi:hypothetical protein
LRSCTPTAIGGILGGIGGLAGGIAGAVNSSKQRAEEERHNKEMEEIERNKVGSGMVSNVASQIPLLGNILGPLLEKIGLGVDEINAFKKCQCEFHKHGYGLFLAPYKK